MKEALSQADFVQENGPERPDFKMKLFADMDDATPPDSIIASSSSGITPSVMQSKCKHPERVLVGHPFNPPHIIPLVEVVGGAKTSPEAIQQAMSVLRVDRQEADPAAKEMPGHVANRLQSALYREMLYLIEQGVLSVADADDAVSWGPGLRWGVMGPSLQWHLAGGAGGIKHFMEGVFEGLAPVFKSLGDPKITLSSRARSPKACCRRPARVRSSSLPRRRTSSSWVFSAWRTQRNRLAGAGPRRCRLRAATEAERRHGQPLIQVCKAAREAVPVSRRPSSSSPLAGSGAGGLLSPSPGGCGAPAIECGPSTRERKWQLGIDFRRHPECRSRPSTTRPA